MELVFAGVPLGPIISLLVELIKRYAGAWADRNAVWLNIALSTVAFIAVCAWQQGQISTEAANVAVYALGILSTVLSAAGTYDMATNAKEALSNTAP